MSEGFYDRERVKKYGNNLVKCLICGKSYARIGTHAVQAHHYKKGFEYYAEFHLTKKEGTSPLYRGVMREHVELNGTMSNLANGVSKRFKKGDERIITKQWWAERKKKI